MKIKIFDKEYDSLTMNGKKYPVKENMYLEFKKWNQIYEEYEYFTLHDFDRIGMFFEFTYLFDLNKNYEGFQILYD